MFYYGAGVNIEHWVGVVGSTVLHFLVTPLGIYYGLNLLSDVESARHCTCKGEPRYAELLHTLR
jgi:hypothetical protein